MSKWQRSSGDIKSISSSSGFTSIKSDPEVTEGEKKVPDNAFVGGTDNGPLYVARAPHEGNVLPGKVTIGRAWFPYQGAEIELQDYDILVGDFYSWASHKPGDPLPENAVPGGNTASGETLYIGRVNREGKDVVGKIQLSLGKCFVPFYKVEYAYDNYEILVIN